MRAPTTFTGNTPHGTLCAWGDEILFIHGASLAKWRIFWRILDNFGMPLDESGLRNWPRALGMCNLRVPIFSTLARKECRTLLGERDAHWKALNAPTLLAEFIQCICASWIKCGGIDGSSCPPEFIHRAGILPITPHPHGLPGNWLVYFVSL